MKSNGKVGIAVLAFLILAFTIVISAALDNVNKMLEREEIRIISSTDNKDAEKIILDYAKENNIDVEIDYAGTLEIMEKLNAGEEYDAVWASNSMWVYMLENSSVSNSKIINMNPVVFGIRKEKAKELGFVDKEVYLEDILKTINDGKLKFAMTSATQTNTGACAYLGFLSVLAGNPEVLTEEHLNNEETKEKLKDLLNGVERTSGDEEFLEEMYIKGECDAIVTYETSIININKRISNPDDQIYAIYTRDGVSLSDNVFAYLGKTNTPKEEQFLKLQTYLLSNEGQAKLMEKGRRVWYGGVKEDVDKTMFNPEWGIDTTSYITPIKFPSTNIIKKALVMYQSELRKPIHIVFALDYSGSMSGDGHEQLTEAMNYILTEEEASKNFLQFSSKDKISLIFFSTNVSKPVTITDGTATEELKELIKKHSVTGTTNIYDSVTTAVKLLESEDMNTYNTSIVLMTDGIGNTGNQKTMKETIENSENIIPVYSILFGDADEEQLQDIANLTSGKVFDGTTNLLEAFKSVRGYN